MTFAELLWALDRAKLRIALAGILFGAAAWGACRFLPAPFESRVLLLLTGSEAQRGSHPFSPAALNAMVGTPEFARGILAPSLDGLAPERRAALLQAVDIVAVDPADSRVWNRTIRLKARNADPALARALADAAAEALVAKVKELTVDPDLVRQAKEIVRLCLQRQDTLQNFDRLSPGRLQPEQIAKREELQRALRKAEESRDVLLTKLQTAGLESGGWLVGALPGTLKRLGEASEAAPARPFQPLTTAILGFLVGVGLVSLRVLIRVAAEAERLRR